MIKNKKGLSLIELIVALSLVSIIIIIGFSIYSLGLKSYTSETVNIENQGNIRYGANYITREIRKSNSVSVSDDILIINGIDEYKLDNHIIWKNDTKLIDGIDSFNITKVENKITIDIISLPNVRGNSLSLSFPIYIRE